jgi:hypothetical protein
VIFRRRSKSEPVELLILAVTRLSTGVCVAGVDDGGNWVRPTRENDSGWRQLDVTDLYGTDGHIVVDVGHWVRWPLARPIPRDVHTEDREVASGARPSLIRKLSHDDARRSCEAIHEEALPAFLADNTRSLILIKPDGVDAIRFDADDAVGRKARIEFSCAGERCNLSVTDLRWRALAKHCLAESGRPTLTWRARTLVQRFDLHIEYLGIGKGQPLDGVCWPLITSVIADKPLPVAIDYHDR